MSTTQAAKEANALIDRSESHDEIARGEWSEGLHRALVARCEDRTETNDGYDYWRCEGDSDNPSEEMRWRVELRKV